MVTVLTHGVGTSCSDGSISGKKTQFNPGETVWAGMKVSHSPGKVKLTIDWQRWEDNQWKFVWKWDHWGQEGWTATSICASFIQNIQGKYRAIFSANDGGLTEIEFNIGTPPPTSQGYEIESTPSGARVYEGITYLGTTPFSIALPWRSHTLTFRKEGYHDRSLTVGTRPDGSAIQINTTLQEKPPEPEPTPTTITLTSTPPGAKIFLNEIDVEQFTNVSFPHDDGDFELKLTLDGYEDFIIGISVLPNQDNQWNWTLIKKEEKSWFQKLIDILVVNNPLLFGFLDELAFATYETITGKQLTEEEMNSLTLQGVEFLLPLNAFSKLLTGENLKGETEEFGTTQDYIDVASAIVMFIPFGKIPGIGTRIAAKTGGRGLLGVGNQAVTKKATPEAVEALLQTDGYRFVLEAMRESPAMYSKMIVKWSPQTKAKVMAGLFKQHPRTAYNLMEKALLEDAIKARGFSGLLTRIAQPKTILWGMSGLLGGISMAYGISFGTEWFAKEGLWELYAFPLADKMRDFRFEQTDELKAIIEKDIAKLREVVPKAQKLVSSISWLWPFTKESWDIWANGLDFELKQIEDEFAFLTLEVELPEVIRAFVRDIIDGDTIDVGIYAKEEGGITDVKLPEYQTSGHARVRLVGINAPEKSPKGEILCTDIEIYQVDPMWADSSRDRLLYLNDKEVYLYVDPAHKFDTYGRILAVIKIGGEDLGLRQVKEGLACYYFRETNKYVNDEEYRLATTTAKNNNVGMWAIIPEQPGIPEEEKITFTIDSNPSNAPVSLDGTLTHHNTPTDEVEQKDMFHLWTEGKHTLKVTKSGMETEVEINLVKGERFELVVDLTAMPPPEEPPEEPTIPTEPDDKDKLIEDLRATIINLNTMIETLNKKIEELTGVPAPPPPEPPPEPTPTEFTSNQLWALGEAMNEIWNLTEGAKQISEEERVNLIASFSMYSTEQKQALDLLWADVTTLTKGRAQLSKDEFDNLKIKYGV